MEWITASGEEVIEQEGARLCTEADFVDMGFREIYDEFTEDDKIAILCVDSVDKIYIQNNVGSHRGKQEVVSTKFVVERCSKKDNPNCREDSNDIETFNFPNFYFELHHVTERLEITKQGDKPVAVQDQILSIIQFSHSKF